MFFVFHSFFMGNVPFNRASGCLGGERRAVKHLRECQVSLARKAAALPLDIFIP